MKDSSLTRVRFIAKIGILSAIAFVLTSIDFPLWFAPTFYKLDFSEVIALIGTYALGPLAGVLIELIKNILSMPSSSTAYVGELANFVMGCAFIVPAGFLYRYHKNKKGAVVSIVVGTLSMTVVAALLNYFVMIPMYSTLYNMPLETIIDMGNAINKGITNLFGLIVLAVVPFNLFKGVVVGIITMLLYKKLSFLLKK